MYIYEYGKKKKEEKNVELVQRKNLNPFSDFITIKKAEVKKEEHVSLEFFLKEMNLKIYLK